MYRKFFKRALDILLSLIGIIVLSIPMLIIAIIIKCDSKGPAIFKTERIGKNNKTFKFYKFRSMSTAAPKDCAPRLLKDCESYITKVGKFIRKTSLDELPQLFCIFVGTMSIIGPRPSGKSELDLIEARGNTGADKIKPGLTGLAQINGRDILATDIQKKAEFDGEYAKRITFFKDAKIFFKTIAKVFIRDGIIEGEKALQPQIQTSVIDLTATAELAATNDLIPTLPENTYSEPATQLSNIQTDNIILETPLQIPTESLITQESIRHPQSKQTASRSA